MGCCCNHGRCAPIVCACFEIFSSTRHRKCETRTARSFAAVQPGLAFARRSSPATAAERCQGRSISNPCRSGRSGPISTRNSCRYSGRSSALIHGSHRGSAIAPSNGLEKRIRPCRIRSWMASMPASGAGRSAFTSARRSPLGACELPDRAVPMPRCRSSSPYRRFAASSRCTSFGTCSITCGSIGGACC